MNTPVQTTHISSLKATAATTLSTPRLRSISSIDATVAQNPHVPSSDPTHRLSAVIASASSSDAPRGFSHRTGLPSAKAASAISRSMHS